MLYFISQQKRIVLKLTNRRNFLVKLKYLTHLHRCTVSFLYEIVNFVNLIQVRCRTI